MSSIRYNNGKWKDTTALRQEAIRFTEKGYYCESPIGTPEWLDYWKEQLRRCTEGYEVDGVKITGDFYSYLNFGQILKVEYDEDSDDVTAKKTISFPDFWDGDYEFFWCLEIARNGLFTKNTQVPSTDKEKKFYNDCNRKLKNLNPNSEEYNRIKEERDKVSLQVLDRLKLFSKPHLDYLNGGYHFVIGKEQPDSCIVKTPFGDRCIGDLRDGDVIYNTYGSMSKVLSVNPQGLKDVYEITLFDGRKTRCGLEHLWEIYSSINKKNIRTFKTMTTKELLNKPLKVGTKFKRYIKIAEPVEKLAKDYIIPPYTLGAWLGDGNMLKQTRLSGKDEEINNKVFDEIQRTFKDLNLKTIRRGNYWEYSFLTKNKEQFRYYRDLYGYPKIGTCRINPLYKEFENLGVNCKTENKFIPTEYKEGSIIQRLELVKGLMDTDGYISKDGSMGFGNTSLKLVMDLQEVLYSLGVQATYRQKTDGIHYLYINSDINLFYIKRKKDRFRKEAKRRKYVPIVDIKKLDYKENSTCILVDSEDHCYLTDNYIVTHNSRRKGFSYKSAYIIANAYNTVRSSVNAIGAYEKKFIDQTMDKTLEYLNFFNEYTGFSKNRLIDKKNYVKSGYIEEVNGVNIEKGYKSIIDATRTFKDNPDAMRGLDLWICLLEEVGAFDNFKDSLSAIRPALTAGNKITGQIIAGGTSGDLEKGTADYADCFYNPIAYGFMPFVNIWDNNAEDTVCGYFHPVQLNMEGFYDKQGNSDIEGALKWENERRKKILANSSSSAVLYKHMQEYPTCPADAFSMTSHSVFPVEELRNRLNQIQAKSIHIKKGIPVTLHYNLDKTKVLAKPDLNNNLNPIYNYKPKTNDLTGAVVIYEFPSDKVPQNFYKIGYDPYRQNNGTSLSAITVFKGHWRGEKTKYKIVAEYYGRPQNSDMANEIALKLAMLYNTQVMVENEVTHPITYFERKKALKYLAAQPDRAISNSIQSSKVDRKYGCHMTDKIKEDCIKYTNDWLLNGYEDDFGNTLSVIDEIDCPGFIEELLMYNRKGNFDRVSSFFMCMMQLQEQELEKEYSTSVDRVTEVINFLNKINGRR